MEDPFTEVGDIDKPRGVDVRVPWPDDHVACGGHVYKGWDTREKLEEPHGDGDVVLSALVPDRDRAFQLQQRDAAAIVVSKV